MEALNVLNKQGVVKRVMLILCFTKLSQRPRNGRDFLLEWHDWMEEELVLEMWAVHLFAFPFYGWYKYSFDTSDFVEFCIIWTESAKSDNVEGSGHDNFMRFPGIYVEFICRLCSQIKEMSNLFFVLYSRLKKSKEMQQYADIYLLLNYSKCFERPSRPSLGVYKSEVATSGTDHTVWGERHIFIYC